MRYITLFIKIICVTYVLRCLEVSITYMVSINTIQIERFNVKQISFNHHPQRIESDIRKGA